MIICFNVNECLFFMKSEWKEVLQIEMEIFSLIGRFIKLVKEYSDLF